MHESGARFWVNDGFLTPATVEKQGRTTPVWIQGRFEAGEFAPYLRNNGCGHCGVAMAANLCGVAIDPYAEYCECRALWGAPGAGQGNWLSVAGARTMLAHLGVPAALIPIPSGGEAAAADRLFAALAEGKLALFVSEPRTPDNPFSTGLHYVLAVGLCEDGRALVANSSLKGRTDPLGIQFADRETVAAALTGAAAPLTDTTWGVAEPGERFRAAFAAFLVIG